jgi:flagellar biosynthesis protein FlhG
MDQAEGLRNISNIKNITKVIAITSGKGGVGKTNLISNIGFILSKIGKKVLLMDADLGLGNIDILLGLTPKYNISHVLKGEKNLQDIIINGPGGINIIPASSGIQKVTDLNESEKLILMEQFDNLDKEYDYFLIDTGAGISKNVTYFCVASQEIIVVATPEPTSITDAYALIKVLYKNYQEKSFNLIVNMAKNKSDALQVYNTISLVIDKYLGMEISLSYLGFIPDDDRFHQAVRKQKLVTNLFPESEIVKNFSNLIKKLEKFSIDMSSKGNIQFFWNKLMNL